LLIICRLQSYDTSTHTNCLIQLLKSGWLSVSLQPRRAFYSSVSICQAVIFEIFQNFLINFNHLRFVRLGVSRQREANSTALPPAVNCLFHRCRFSDLNRSPSALSETLNSLIFKEFFVPTASEVGRIIERSRGASSTYFTAATSFKRQAARRAAPPSLAAYDLRLAACGY
jgi:hypothetical protein